MEFTRKNIKKTFETPDIKIVKIFQKVGWLHIGTYTDDQLTQYVLAWPNDMEKVTL